MPGFYSALGLLVAPKESLTLTRNARAVLEQLHDPELGVDCVTALVNILWQW